MVPRRRSPRGSTDPSRPRGPSLRPQQGPDARLPDTLTLRRGDAAARAVIGPLAKTRRRTEAGSRLPGSVCGFIVASMWNHNQPFSRWLISNSIDPSHVGGGRRDTQSPVPCRAKHSWTERGAPRRGGGRPGPPPLRSPPPSCDHSHSPTNYRLQFVNTEKEGDLI